jgi:5-methylcytosine-specific restriction endonuclease McrA
MEADDQHRVLVLNRVWQPINVVGAKRAFSLLFQDHAQVIDPNEGDFRIFNGDQWIEHSLSHPPTSGQAAMHTVRMALLVPKVLLLRSFDRVPVKDVKFSRQSIFERDGYRCQYTGRIFPPKMLNIDHVIPRDRGGRTTWENVVTSSIHCNTLKANRLPHEAGLKLIRKPAKPRSRPFISHLMGTTYDQAWSWFLEIREGATSEV